MLRHETIKLLAENIGGMVLHLGLAIIFGFDTKSKSNKSQKKQEGQHQTKKKKFLHSKETNNTMKRQPTEWKKLFSNQITDKG